MPSAVTSRTFEYATRQASLGEDGFGTAGREREAMLEQMGGAGWELVTVVPAGGDYYSFTWIFKREVETGEG